MQFCEEYGLPHGGEHWAVRNNNRIRAALEAAEKVVS
jgi:hypothetical protein